MTDIDDIRSRMYALTEQARRMLALHDAGAVRRAECLALAREMQLFHGQDDHGLLDLADRAEAIGDHRRAEELYQTAMEVEGELLQGAAGHCWLTIRIRVSPHSSRAARRSFR